MKITLYVRLTADTQRWVDASSKDFKEFDDQQAISAFVKQSLMDTYIGHCGRINTCQIELGKTYVIELEVFSGEVQNAF